MPLTKHRPGEVEAEASNRPPLRGIQTDDLSHFTGAHGGEDLSLEEQTAVLQAMTLESPPGIQSPQSLSPYPSPGIVQSPTSLSTESGFQTHGSASTPTTPITPLSPPAQNSSPSQSKFVSALQDVRHFAGGLINHPYESTKHYTILRHSFGIVYYSGSSTNLAITIFSDRELAPDRTLWLQRRGFSGKTGLKIGGILGARSTWIDVTPSTRATPEQVNPTDERAWQRDIKKFLKKAPKELRSHRPRETDILRIPCDADDGYLRVVLCSADGKRTLCGSPVFRLASFSTDSSVIRGSSLKSMPLEAGIKLANVVGKQFITATAGPYVQTARQTVTNQLTSVYQPSALAQQAFTTAYDESGIPNRFDNMNEQYYTARDESYSRTDLDGYDALARPNVVGPATGPVPPFPVRFHGKVVAGTGRSRAVLNMPTANLTGIPEDVLLRYKGVFFGWAAVNLPSKLAAEKDISDEWRQAIIFISPDPYGRRTVVEKNTARVYLIHDFQSVDFVDAKVSVLVMGYLRALEPGSDKELHVEAQLFDFYKDVAITNASLARPAWAADATLERVKSASSNRSLTERYVDFRQSTQRQIDRVPVHRLGVRTEGATLKDRLIGNGGVWIPRSPLTHNATS
ncbi:uncharacterized protein Z520_11354 [Fonsecaea multimorphosa CBS 102226]|uniref:Riboflavin kinase n=1 Tax=Fonsecaea multimorphosa CBS 102226 TaxID=1442371 RepID=A0A0D2K952_9EURO|nr:uncharacterized protein Z520_11354 [Fonsecaea multimorphosa CBS 102226]KIX92878.1 hypothetical protein Z520_11354 [Fonsecaea multimorphosa CBS 102226]OAL18127.1 hypothetical protein AYO22_10904 [Fonsecaea multimorphosa]